MLGCDGFGQLSGDTGHPPDGIEQGVRARVGDVSGVDRRVYQTLPAHLERERQPAVDRDPQIPLDLGVQLTADGLE